MQMLRCTSRRISGVSYRNYRDVFNDVQRATTLPPTEVMIAIAATMISPAISAYSNTSPPRSSAISRFNICTIFISFSCDSWRGDSTTLLNVVRRETGVTEGPEVDFAYARLWFLTSMTDSPM